MRTQAYIFLYIALSIERFRHFRIDFVIPNLVRHILPVSNADGVGKIN